MIQVEDKDVGGEVESSTEGLFAEVAQEVDNQAPETQVATGTVTRNPTRTEVESWVNALMRQHLENEHDAIVSAVEDTFIEALNVTIQDMGEDDAKTDFYKIVRHAVDNPMDDKRIRDIITRAA